MSRRDRKGHKIKKSIGPGLLVVQPGKGHLNNKCLSFLLCKVDLIRVLDIEGLP